MRKLAFVSQKLQNVCRKRLVALLQGRDYPDDIYRKISMAAKKQKRTIAQQVLAFLKKAMGQEQSNIVKKKTAS
jgi:hypothetical protein